MKIIIEVHMCVLTIPQKINLEILLVDWSPFVLDKKYNNNAKVGRNIDGILFEIKNTSILRNDIK